MSNNTKKTSLGMRILLLLLVALMVGSLAFYTVFMIIDQIRSNIENTEDAGTGKDYSSDDGHDHDDADTGSYY